MVRAYQLSTAQQSHVPYLCDPFYFCYLSIHFVPDPYLWSTPILETRFIFSFIFDAPILIVLRFWKIFPFLEIVLPTRSFLISFHFGLIRLD